MNYYDVYEWFIIVDVEWNWKLFVVWLDVREDIYNF